MNSKYQLHRLRAKNPQGCSPYGRHLCRKMSRMFVYLPRYEQNEISYLMCMCVRYCTISEKSVYMSLMFYPEAEKNKFTNEPPPKLSGAEHNLFIFSFVWTSGPKIMLDVWTEPWFHGSMGSFSSLVTHQRNGLEAGTKPTCPNKRYLASTNLMLRSSISDNTSPQWMAQWVVTKWGMSTSYLIHMWVLYST